MLDLKLGESKVTVKITDLQQKQVMLEGKEPSSKLVLVTETSGGRIYNIDEVWIKGKELQSPKGLWITLDNTGNINASSTLGRFLKHMQVDSLKDLIGRCITLAPKENNFMAAIAYTE